MPVHAETVSVSELVEGRPLGGYQILILILCFLVALMDGFDSQAIGVTAPLMLAQLHLQPAQLGAIFSGSSWGFLVGALVFGPCADRWGRKRFLVLAGLLFSICTVATPWAGDFTTLLILRVATGLGLGGAAPCFVSIATEYVPRRMRAGLVTVLWAALPGGGMIVGFLGPLLLPSYGWQSVYYTGGAASLAIMLLVIAMVPESVAYLVTRGGSAERIRRIVARTAPGAAVTAAARFIVTEATQPGVPLRHLFTEGRALTTLLLWVAFFIDYFVLIALLVWTPSLLKQAGMPVGQASVALGLNNFGGVIGCVVAGYLIDRFGPYRILILTFLLAFLSAGLTGYSAPSFIPVALLETLDGLLVGGAGAGLIAFAALFYPGFMRSTGVGWGLGLGRLGGAMGPLLGGFLVASGWHPAEIFLVFGAIMLAAVPIIMVMRQCDTHRRTTTAGPTVLTASS